MNARTRERTNPNSGQTLVIAVMVMMILAVVATVFIAIVARNLFSAGRYSQADAVAQIAEAGIRYADQMLTSSEDGADWRPVPDNVGVTDPGNPVTGVPPTADTGTSLDPARANWQYLRDEHPDYKWTRAYWPTEWFPTGYTPASPDELGCAGPSGGYTTFNSGQGRYLLRVSYDPDPNQPLSKYIKIESIGRWDVIMFDPATGQFDPTTLKRAGFHGLRREVTAYKPIGLTDYLRFITNKSDRSVDMPLGVPGYQLNFGRPAPAKFGEAGIRGGPIRVNGNLAWFGDYQPDGGPSSVDIFLRGGYDQAGNRFPIDRVEVSGQTRVDTAPDDDTRAVRVNLHALMPSDDGKAVDVPALPSADPDFTTFHGFYRDGFAGPDAQGHSRQVKRIEPPLVDQADPTNTTTRYRLLTLNSGDRIRNPSNTTWINTGALGWGRGIYIGNTRDKQSESETLVGGYTVRADWLKPNSPLSTYWKGPYYVPPACIIVLHPNDTDGDGQPDLTITRTDVSTATGWKAIWYDAWGNPRPDWGQTVTMPYPHPANGRDLRTDFGGVPLTKHIDGNGVIYAEGNIRIRGMLPPGMQLTVVSNQNIYIEGSILKYRDPDVLANPAYDSDPYRGADNTCGIALLARENVCINTTQFFSPISSVSSDDVASDAGNDMPPFHVIVRDSPESQLRCMFEFGPWESETWWASNPGGPPAGWMLFLRHAGQYGPTYINCWLNPMSTLANWGIVLLNKVFPGLPEHVWGVGDPNYGKPGFGIGSAFVGDVFPFAGSITNGLLKDVAMNASLFVAPGLANIIQLALDQTSYTRNNYLMGGLAVQPMDVRIEAIIYAQEGSFFVLPGNWFNPNPSDVPGAASPRNGVAPEFPFFGQPLDTRIIVDGAISENLPAAVSDVSEWMSKWGRIPEKYGSSGRPTAHPNEGLTLLYDDHVGWPLDNLTDPSKPSMPIRYDRFGRALPIAPKLPVCTSLVYSGDVM